MKENFVFFLCRWSSGKHTLVRAAFFMFKCIIFISPCISSRCLLKQRYFSIQKLCYDRASQSHTLNSAAHQPGPVPFVYKLQAKKTANETQTNKQTKKPTKHQKNPPKQKETPNKRNQHKTLNLTFSLLKKVFFVNKLQKPHRTKPVHTDHWICWAQVTPWAFSFSKIKHDGNKNTCPTNSKCSVLKQRSPDNAQPHASITWIPGNAILKWSLNMILANSCLQFTPVVPNPCFSTSFLPP